MRAAPAAALLLVAFAGCDAANDAGPSAPGCSGATCDAGLPTDSATSVDASARDAGPALADAGDASPSLCRELGLPAQPFAAASATFGFGDIAGDFTVNTLYDGPWSLEANWTGCESFVFLNFIPTNGQFEEQLWGSASEVLVTDTPVNAHFFFMSWETDEAARRDRVSQILGYVDSYIEFAFADPDEQARQRGRFHYVTDLPRDISGSVGGFVNDYMRFQGDRASAVDLGDRGIAPPPLPFVFAIDRDQAWDAGGNLSQFVGGTPAFKMAAFLPGFFDHKAAIRDAQAAATGVETFVLLDERVEDRVFEREAVLPAAAQMAAFDTLEIDVAVTCPHRNVFACSEWDRIARVEVCLDAMCSERRELVRWITPYWRRGQRRWVIDASALMGLLADGGTQRFRIVTGPSWERKTPRDVRVAVRLSNTGRGDRGVGYIRAFTGGGFNASYNMRDPVAHTPPASATRVELVLMVSGHGQDMTTNCAEWCDHRHQFAVNGVPLPEIRHEGMIGSEAGCGPAASRGAPPGQFGNWAPERAYWCPGSPVDHIRLDVTGLMTLGSTNTVTYSANYQGRAPAGGNIDLTAYLAWFQ